MSSRNPPGRTRGHHRCLLSLPVVFSWRDAKGNIHQGKGSTRNISASGLFFNTRDYVPAGASIQFEVVLPPMSRETSSLRLVGKADVVRVGMMEPEEGWLGVAVANTQVALRDTQRKFPRQKLEIPVKFAWTDARGRQRKGKGVARDVSAGGFYLVTRDQPPVESAISFEAYLPPVGPDARAMRLQGEAQFLRVESEETHGNQGWRGLAAAAERVVLHEVE